MLQENIARLHQKGIQTHEKRTKKEVYRVSTVEVEVANRLVD